MCYNPAVSLGTAIIEWILAIILPIKYKKATMRYFFSALLVFLGIYQFTEFMLCQTGQLELWMRAGFIAYTVLPAIALHGTVTFLKIKLHPVWIYIIPAVYIIMALVSGNFVDHGQCHTIFITARNTLFSANNPIKIINLFFYSSYYFGFIIATCILMARKLRKEKNQQRQKLILLTPLAIFLMSVPTFILLVLFPILEVRFPSVLCHFALLLALTVFIGARYEHQLNIK